MYAILHQHYPGPRLNHCQRFGIVKQLNFAEPKYLVRSRDVSSNPLLLQLSNSNNIVALQHTLQNLLLLTTMNEDTSKVTADDKWSVIETITLRMANVSSEDDLQTAKRVALSRFSSVVSDSSSTTDPAHTASGMVYTLTLDLTSALWFCVCVCVHACVRMCVCVVLTCADENEIDFTFQPSHCMHVTYLLSIM